MASRTSIWTCSLPRRRQQAVVELGDRRYERLGRLPRAGLFVIERLMS